MSKKKEFKNSSAQEQTEGLPVQDVNAPAGRMQSKQQIADTMAATDVDPGVTNGVVLKEDNVPSQVVHTTKAAEIEKSIKGITSGGGSGGVGSASLRSGSYSGNSGIISDMSATTQLGEADRKPTRTGKKLDSTLKHVNYMTNEQVKVKYDESKPLAENPDAVQGYNGTYRNEHARTQKNSGFVPAELYYDRSVDEIHQDFVYPIFGQSINDPAPKTIASYTDDGYVDFNTNRGNHAHASLNVKIDKTGAITGFSFSDLDFTPEQADHDVENVSAVNAIIDANQAELDRQVMDSNAGDELSPKWNPLPRSIKNPTATIGLLRDIEGSTGAEVYMAYKKTSMGMSYQLNKAAKDGQRIETPIGEMFLGCIKDDVKDITAVRSLKNANEFKPFSEANMKAGSASAIIAFYDSTSKYTTKGDYLIQPRGLRMHLQTAENNMKVLRVPSKFVEAVSTNEVFSTIDTDYDPFMPVCISDKASLAHPYSLNSFISNNKPSAFRYAYSNGSNNTYVTEVYHPLVKGLYEWFKSMGSKIYSVLTTKEEKDNNAEATISIPCMHSTTGFSLWSLIILAATPFIVKARLTSLIDVFDYEENFGYPFSQLVSLETANPTFAKNYINSDYNEPISIKKMLPGVAFKWVFPESYWIALENSSSAQIVMPWYHNEKQYKVEDNKIVLSDTPCAMSMPSVRSGSRFAFLDTIYGMTERDVRLCLDRQTVYPGYKKNVNTSALSVYKYGLTGDGQPKIELNHTDFTFENLMKTPREIGYVIPAPNGMLTQCITEFTSEDDFKTSRIKLTDEFESKGCGSFRIRYWHGVNNTRTTSILAKDAINISRGMSLQQDFRVIINQRMVGSYRDFTTQDFIVSFSALFDATAANPAIVNNRGLFTPFLNGSDVETESKLKQVSFQKYFWTRLQRLPFAVNPFDCSPQKKDLGSKDSVHSDPFDFIYIYGCAGFRASDYNEDSYNREKERLNLGMTFVQDPYFNESPIYRG